MNPQQVVAFQILVRAITGLPAQIAAANSDALAQSQPHQQQLGEPGPGFGPGPIAAPDPSGPGVLAELLRRLTPTARPVDGTSEGRDPDDFRRDAGPDLAARSAEGRTAQRGAAMNRLDALEGRKPAGGGDIGREPGRVGAMLESAIGGSAKAAGSALAGVGTYAGLLALKFVAVAGPAAVLAAALQSPISGFQVLGKSVQLLGTVLAPVLLPATVLAATALVALSDVVLATLMPGMEGFFGIMLSLGIPALITFVGALQAVTESAQEFAAWVERNTPGDKLKRLEEMGKETTRSFDTDTGKIKGGSSLFDGAMANLLGFVAAEPGSVGRAAAGGGEGRGKASPEQMVMNALRDVMGSLRNSVGPKAQISGLESVGKSAQLAALNNDPLEARMLRTQQQIYQLMERAVAQMENRRGVYAPGRGEGWDNSGAGRGDAGGDF